MIGFKIEYNKFKWQKENNFEKNDISVIKGSLQLANFVITNLEQVLVQNVAHEILQNIIQENIYIIYFDSCWIAITLTCFYLTATFSLKILNEIPCFFQWIENISFNS